MADRDFYCFIDTYMNAHDFGIIETCFNKYEYYLDCPDNPEKPIGVIAGPEQDYDGNTYYHTRQQFEEMLRVKHTVCFNIYGKRFESIVFVAVERIQNTCCLYINLCSDEGEEELLIKLCLNIAHLFATSRKLIGFYVDTRSNYPDYNWRKFFLKGELEKRGLELDKEIEDFEKYARPFVNSGVLGQYLPPLFGIRLSLADQLEPTEHWCQAKIVGDVLFLYNPATAVTYHDTTLKLEDIT